jgi:hypothetical protein
MGHYGMPYDSTIGVAPIWGVVSFCILLYIVLRVWWQLNRDKKKVIEINSLKKNIGKTQTMLFFHEDDFCQIELLGNENQKYIQSQCEKIRESSEKNFNSIGYTDVFIRDDIRVELNTKQILADDFENLLFHFGFSKASKVITGYGQSYRIPAPNTIGFGKDYAAIYFKFEENIITKIWLTQPWKMEKDKLTLFLKEAGRKWGLLLIDWEATEIVNLLDEDAILNYLS